MTQQVQVVKIAEGKVLVSAGVVETILGSRERRYWAANRFEVVRGSWVEVGLSSGRALLEVLLLAALPITLVTLLYSWSGRWFDAAVAAQPSRVLLAVLGLPLGLLLFAGLRKLLPPSGPEVLKLIDEAPDLGQGCGNGCVCRLNKVGPARLDD